MKNKTEYAVMEDFLTGKYLSVVLIGKKDFLGS